MAGCAPGMQFRHRYAVVLRHFLAGRLTTDQYEHAYGELESRYGADEAAWAVFACVWHLYDDVFPHRMRGRHQLSRESRHHLARWVVFLRSGAELADVSHAAPAPPSKWQPSAEGVLKVLLFGYLCIASVAVACAGVVLAWPAAMVSLAALICSVSDMSGGGVSLEPLHAQHAFSDDPDDPWPFRSRGDLEAAVARPTYLHG